MDRALDPRGVTVMTDGGFWEMPRPSVIIDLLFKLSKF